MKVSQENNIRRGKNQAEPLNQLHDYAIHYLTHSARIWACFTTTFLKHLLKGPVKDSLLLRIGMIGDEK